MLDFERLQTIASILHWSTEDVETSLAELNEGFMVPDVNYFHGDPETGSFLEPNDPRHEDARPGFYHRLSAPGYMDCTDWSGPFDTEEAAVADLLSTYGD